MVKAKYCVACSRLLSLDVVKCPCIGTEFIEVILDYLESREE